MGEIHHPRHESLYVLRYWEILEIIRGYHRRQRSRWEMTRLIAWASANCMGGENIKPPHRWLPFWWESLAFSDPDDPDDSPIPTPDDVERMRQLIRDENARLQKESAAP